MRRLFIIVLLVISSLHAVPKQAYQATHDQDSANKTVNTPSPSFRVILPRHDSSRHINELEAGSTVTYRC